MFPEKGQIFLDGIDILDLERQNGNGRKKTVTVALKNGNEINLDFTDIKEFKMNGEIIIKNGVLKDDSIFKE